MEVSSVRVARVWDIVSAVDSGAIVFISRTRSKMEEMARAVLKSSFRAEMKEFLKGVGSRVLVPVGVV